MLRKTWKVAVFVAVFGMVAIGHVRLASILPSFLNAATIAPPATTTAAPQVPPSREFVVWMFPFPPSNNESFLVSSSTAETTLLCPFSNACGEEHQEMINLRSLTENTPFENYIRDHAYHKIRHWRDFPTHIQVITMLSLLRKYPGSCVRTLGNSRQFCNPNAFPHYNPYDDYNQWNFPIENSTLQDTFPKEFVTAAVMEEQFAIHGVYPQDPGGVVGYYNSGNDVQWLAAAHWVPYVTDVRHWKDALQNYTGHLIGNALSNFFDAPVSNENIHKFELLSNFMIIKLVDSQMAFFQKYTNETAPFGSRSTVLHRQLLDRKLKSYFSACLTLTTNIQGATLINPNKHAPNLNAMEISSTPPIGAHEVNVEKRVFVVDAQDLSFVPPDIRKHAKILYANIPRRFPLDPHPYRALISYAYRLVSQYAKEAKVMITSRIHVGLPCLALGIPVIFIKPPNGKLPGGKEQTGRVAGLFELFHQVSSPTEWTFGNSTAELVVPPNPGNDAADRYRASFWNRLKRNSFYRDNAYLFGMIPFRRRLGLANDDIVPDHTFHFVLEQVSWHTKRAMELVYYYHPNARVYVHSNNKLDMTTFETFVESGYALAVLPLDDSSLTNSDISMDQAQALLSKYGGVVLSKTTFLLSKIPHNISRVAKMGSNGNVVFAIGGMQEELHPYWKAVLLDENDTRQCFKDKAWKGDWNDALAVSFEPTALLSMDSTTVDTECYKILEAKCIYCDEVHVDFG